MLMRVFGFLGTAAIAGAAVVSHASAQEVAGGYFGAGVGLTSVGVEEHYDPGTTGNPSLTADYDATGVQGDVFAGYGGLVGDLYLGAELHGGYSGAEASLTVDGDSVEERKNWTVGAAARFGFPVRRADLLYGRLGWVMTEYEAETSIGSATETVHGIRAGAGYEVDIGNGFARFEYTYTIYEDIDYGYAATGEEVSIETSENLFMVGVGWRF